MNLSGDWGQEDPVDMSFSWCPDYLVWPLSQSFPTYTFLYYCTGNSFPNLMPKSGDTLAIFLKSHSHKGILEAFSLILTKMPWIKYNHSLTSQIRKIKMSKIKSLAQGHRWKVVEIRFSVRSIWYAARLQATIYEAIQLLVYLWWQHQ